MSVSLAWLDFTAWQKEPILTDTTDSSKYHTSYCGVSSHSLWFNFVVKASLAREFTTILCLGSQCYNLSLFCWIVIQMYYYYAVLSILYLHLLWHQQSYNSNNELVLFICHCLQDCEMKIMASLKGLPSINVCWFVTSRRFLYDEIR